MVTVTVFFCFLVFSNTSTPTIPLSCRALRSVLRGNFVCAVNNQHVDCYIFDPLQLEPELLLDRGEDTGSPAGSLATVTPASPLARAERGRIPSANSRRISYIPVSPVLSATLTSGPFPSVPFDVPIIAPNARQNTAMESL